MTQPAKPSKTSKPSSIKLWFTGGDSERADRPAWRIPEIRAAVKLTGGAALVTAGIVTPGGSPLCMFGGAFLGSGLGDVGAARKQRAQKQIDQINSNLMR
jgi:hypothetical protein